MADTPAVSAFGLHKCQLARREKQDINAYFVRSPSCADLGPVTVDTAVTGRLRSSLANAVGALAVKNGPGGSTGHLAEGHKCLAWVESEVRLGTLLLPLLPVLLGCVRSQ
jgi:hypothetical protein